jgi:hypothetical protein
VQALENFPTGPRCGRHCGTLSGANHLLFCWKPKINSGDLKEEQRKHAVLFATTILYPRKMVEVMELEVQDYLYL